MVSSKPALRYSVSPILNDVAMITDEQESPALRHVDLHSYEPICMAGQVMKSDALAEVHHPFIKSLPVATA